MKLFGIHNVHDDYFIRVPILTAIYFIMSFHLVSKAQVPITVSNVN